MADYLIDLLGLRLLLSFFSFLSESTSPGWQFNAPQSFSKVSKLIPRALPFFKRQRVVWLMPVSLASQ